MKAKILRLVKILLLVFVCGFVGLFSFKRFVLDKAKSDYRQQFIKIVYYNALKDPQALQANLEIVVENRGDMLAGSLPLSINYLDKNKRMVGTDQVDILKSTKDVILSHSKKTFTVTLLFPKGSEHIIPQIR